MTMKIYTLEMPTIGKRLFSSRLICTAFMSYLLIENEYEKLRNDFDEEIKQSLEDDERVSASAERCKS